MADSSDSHGSYKSNKLRDRVGGYSDSISESFSGDTHEVHEEKDSEFTYPSEFAHKEGKGHKSKKNHHGDGKKVKNIPVTFKSKLGHPWEKYNTGLDSIHLKGKNGPVIHMFEGVKYNFDVIQDVIPGTEAKHLFILTDSPSGGPNSTILPGFDPVVSGKTTFIPNHSTPKFFFYQDFRDQYAGGIVIYHRKRC